MFSNDLILLKVTIKIKVTKNNGMKKYKYHPNGADTAEDLHKGQGHIETMLQGRNNIIQKQLTMVKVAMEVNIY